MFRYPKKIQIELTNACNLKCEDCLRENMKRKRGSMSVATFLQSLDLAKEFGIEEIHLHNWGEPLLHTNLINFIKIAKVMGFIIGFTTNGSLLTVDKLNILGTFGLNKLDISYNKHTSLEQPFLKELYRYSNDIGIDTWFRCVVFSKKEYKKLRKELKGYNVKFQRGMYFDKDKRRTKPCEAIQNLFIIQWDGVIVPCCAMYDNQYDYGRVGHITINNLKLEISRLNEEILLKSLLLEDCCNHCFEVDLNNKLPYKL